MPNHGLHAIAALPRLPCKPRIIASGPQPSRPGPPTMFEIDHLILRVRNTSASVQFYRQLLGLRHEGRAGPFEVLRVNEGSTLDLLAEAPKDSLHLAFRLDRAAFEAVHARLRRMGIAFGGDPWLRDGRAAQQQGAHGWAEALYFYDPDHHNIEVRTHEQTR